MQARSVGKSLYACAQEPRGKLRMEQQGRPRMESAWVEARGFQAEVSQDAAFQSQGPNQCSLGAQSSSNAMRWDHPLGAQTPHHFDVVEGYLRQWVGQASRHFGVVGEAHHRRKRPQEKDRSQTEVAELRRDLGIQMQGEPLHQAKYKGLARGVLAAVGDILALGSLAAAVDNLALGSLA